VGVNKLLRALAPAAVAAAILAATAAQQLPALALNPQPLPPSMDEAINPQPLPPASAINPQPLPPHEG
jgi:hypothetical protein